MSELQRNSILCNECGRTYASAKSLRKHEKRHQGHAPYRCCGTQFWDRTLLTRHRCNHHGEEKRHACIECKAKFATNCDLNRHFKKRHADKNLVCDICSKRFADNSVYNDHMAGHSGERRHRCRCGKTYIHVSSLSRHTRRCTEPSS